MTFLVLNEWTLISYNYTNFFLFKSWSPFLLYSVNYSVNYYFEHFNAYIIEFKVIRVVSASIYVMQLEM